MNNRDMHFAPAGTALDVIDESAVAAELKTALGTNGETLAPQLPEPERVNVVVVGAGQAGLSVGYHLKRKGIPFVILDAHARIGDSWRTRWDSLRLFTPARYDGLDGLPFPASRFSFPTKDEMADYLEAYAARFQLPVQGGATVNRVSKRDGRYMVDAGPRRFEADCVVAAMANYQKPRLPFFSLELDSHIVQMHSSEYRNPSQFQKGAVLIAGAGNSGSEIAMELASSHRTSMSGRNTGHLPFRIGGFWGRNFFMPLVLRLAFHRVLTLSTPLGRKARAALVHRGGPLIRVKPEELEAAGIERVAKTVGVRDGLPLLEDGRVLDVANVVWCTGFRPGFSWIDLPVFGPDGEPRHTRGVADGEAGFYFVGLHFLYAFSSTMIHGVGRDARFVADHIAARVHALN
jgi:putative flavoprotein involved in K+ transport